MSSISSYYGFNSTRPSIFGSGSKGSIAINDGISVGSVFDDRGSDFLNPDSISGDVSGFSGSISPAISYTPEALFIPNGNAFGTFPSAESILTGTSSFINNVMSPNYGSDFGFNVPVFGDYFQAVPDLGKNPDAFRILGSTSFFTDNIAPYGGGYNPMFSPGFPLGKNPDAATILGQTNNLLNSLALPPYSGNSGFPGMGNPYGYNPYGFSPFIFGGPGTSYFPGGFGFPQQPWGYPAQSIFGQSSFQSQLDLTQLILSQLDADFPDSVPANVPGGVANFLLQFAYADEDKQDELRELLANPTEVNADILNEAGISSEGGLYEQGTVNNPFLHEDFLTDTNPFARYQSGITVTQGNGNGKVLGTQVADTLFGAEDLANIINGRGGNDTVVGGSKEDLINVSQGDKVKSGAGDDVLFFNFDVSDNPFKFETIINGGAGDDSVIISIDGDPTDEDALPVFKSLGNGVTQVKLNNRILYSVGVETFIITDKDGNIGSVLEVDA